MLPVSVFRPLIGVYMWAWVSYMNPHRLTWSYAYSFRFNFFIAIATLLGLMLAFKKTVPIPRRFTVFLLFAFLLWTFNTSFYAFNHPWADWEQLLKIYMMLIATMMTVNTKQSLTILVTIITLSIGFFGIKGGVFTITTGGQFQVLGPARSFFSDNNMFALAELMVVPMFLFLRTQVKHWTVRIAFLGCAFLAALSIVGSYSRGGLVGLLVIMIYFWLRTPAKIRVALGLAIAVPVMTHLMPEKWHNRMVAMLHKVRVPSYLVEIYQPKSIFDPSNDPFPDGEFKETKSILKFSDSSVQGRIQAWELAWRVVQDRPIVGGGFRTFHLNIFRRYLPNAQRRAAHSIYFQVLGEHGFVGLALWLMLHISGFRTKNWIMRNTKKVESLFWAHELARYIGISLMGYYSAGAFLGLAYFDLPFHYITILVILRVYVEKELAKRQPEPKPLPVWNV